MSEQEQKLHEKITKLESIILELIDCGSDMEDAAETCGHEEALEDWKKATKKAKISIDYKKKKKEYAAIREKRWQMARMEDEQIARKKWEKENAKYKEEDEALMKELGILN
jgi:hypothetical protein